MTRRNITTTFMVVGAGLLLFGGVALAREAQTSDNFRPAVVATPTPDDHGGNGADDTASPTASPDDHGGKNGN